MAINQDQIIQMYSSGNEDNRSSLSRSNYMEFLFTEKILERYLSENAKAIEIGCATGYYALLFADRCANYTGIDLTPEHIAIFKQKIAENHLKNVNAAVGNATNLSEIADQSYDLVFCLGPMYHLPDEDRVKVFEECYRIAKEGAILAFSYINRLGAYAGACAHDALRSHYPNAETNEAVFYNNTDDQKPGIFFYTSPEEMEKDALNHKLCILQNYGLDFFFHAAAIDQMTEEQFSCYLELAVRMSESRSCVGLANHALLICRK